MTDSSMHAGLYLAIQNNVLTPTQHTSSAHFITRRLVNVSVNLTITIINNFTNCFDVFRAFIVNILLLHFDGVGVAYNPNIS